MVTNRFSITKRGVIKRANTSEEFAPVLDRLKYSGNSLIDPYQKIYNRIRTIGNSQRDKTIDTIGRAKTCEPVNHLHQMTHHRSLFRNRQDEDIFREFFSDFIIRVAQKEFVRKRDILERAYNDCRFFPLLAKLKSDYPGEDIDQKIYNKARSIGHSRVSFNCLIFI